MKENEKLYQRAINIYDSMYVRLYFLNIELLEIDNELLQRDLENDSSIPPHWHENNVIENQIKKVNKHIKGILNEISIEGLDEIIKKAKPELINHLLEIRYKKIKGGDETKSKK